MKKLFYFFLLGLIISLSLVGCEDSKKFTSFSSTSDLEGVWVRIDEDLYGAYSYEVKGDKIYYRDHEGYINSENFFVYEEEDWDKLIKITVKFEFDKEEQSIYVSGIKAGTFTRIEKDKAYYKDCSGLLKDCSLQRVKGVMSESDVDVSDTYNPDTPTNSTAVNGALPGKFTINDSGTQVQFSQGNLQYKASKKTWRFANQQYYYVGSENENISSTYNGWIDLFGWGTGNNPTNSSTDEADYATFTDWGTNPISNGGNKANAWRTLTKDEWKYLSRGRSKADELYGQALVAGVPGLLLLPDNWVTPSGLTWKADHPGAWTMNVYSVDNWAKMEKAGAVFLPAAGYRRGTGVLYVGSYGGYWSATPDGTDCAYNLGFSSDTYDLQEDNFWSTGLSVRLVR